VKVCCGDEATGKYTKGVRDVPAPSNIIEYVTRLIRATRRDSDDCLITHEWVRGGAGRAAGQAYAGGKAMALFAARLVFRSTSTGNRSSGIENRLIQTSTPKMKGLLRKHPLG